MRATPVHQLLLHIIVFLWGLTAILGKSISLEKPLLVGWRTALAAAGLLCIVLARRTPWPSGPAVLRMLGVGLIIGFHWLLFFLPGKLSTVSAGLVGISSITLWSALLEPLFDKSKRLGVLEICLALGVVGGAVFIGRDDPSTLPGLLLGVGAAFTAAVFACFNGQLIKHHDVFMITLFEMVGASLLMFSVACFLVPFGPHWLPTGKDWLWLMLLSQLCTVLAFSGCTWLQKRLSVYQISIASNLEPVYGVLLAAVIFKEHEQLKPGFWIGGAIITACVLIYPVLSKPRAPEGGV
jgi:drug/metabolite transporter (DMT)-like permease